jgi:diguanylate cyclase (GGDEF)-like protein
MLASALQLLRRNGPARNGQPPIAKPWGTAQEVYQLAVDHMSQGFCVFDADMHVVIANARFAELYGLSPEQVKPGVSLQEIVALRIAAGIYAGATPDDYKRSRVSPQIGAVWDDVLSNGRIIHIVTAPIAGVGWISTHEDVTEHKQREAHLTRAARHDMLTSLPNRQALREQLGLALGQALRGHGSALLFINVDQFRRLNNAYGVATGDGLLKELASRLQRSIKPGDTVFRIGGDEFAIVHSGANAPTAAGNFARSVLERLVQPYRVADQSISAGVSIGIAMLPADALDGEELLKNADIALSSAKKAGGNTFRFFQPEMDVSIRARQRLEVDLRRALANGDFKAFYQPIVDLGSGHVSTFEALVRWEKEGDTIRPDQFISLAEETGLVQPIGAWMLQKACSDAKTWPEPVKVAVNLSVAQFRGTKLSKMVAKVLEETELPAQRLELEITETLLLGDEPSVRKELHTLKDMGVRIAMDDFGTGYSSLGLLSTFPFDKIKIDSSFIRDIGQRDVSLAIFRSIAALGTDLGIVTTAEGIETREQLEIVRREGCKEVQGFFFSPPVLDTEVMTCIKACARRAAMYDGKSYGTARAG